MAKTKYVWNIKYMEFNYFDLIVSVIILFLGLKGILNGFFKELFGLIGIVGGIFIASRVSTEVGTQISDLIFKFENSSAINFTGFIVTLAVFWLVMVGLGQIFKKLSIMSGLGPVDKILGFIFGASKFFLIAAVIAHAAYNIKAVKATVDDAFKGSVVFPILVETGSVIMKLDPVNINETLAQETEEMQKTIEKSVSKSSMQIIDDVKVQIKESMPEITKDINTEEKAH